MRVIELLFVRDLAVSPAQLWPWISDPAHISQWASVEIAPLSPGEGGDPSGAGATRAVRMGPLRMEERVLLSAPPAQLRYSVVEGGLLRWHEATVTLHPTAAGGTRLTWAVSLEPALPGTGWLLRRRLTRSFERDLRALAAIL